MEILTLDHITISRGGRSILSDFNMQVEPGAHHAVVGPSGAGKYTLLGLICGILRPERGRISFLGEALSSLSAAGRDKRRADQMGVVFQNLGLASALTVGGNLALALRMAGKQQDIDFAHGLLNRLGLAKYHNAKPRQLSRGEAQRAAIARALVARPKLLIADEPTASLDTVWRNTVMDILFEQADQQQLTLVVSTHDPAITDRFAHKVALPQGQSQ
ncbi:MAG: ATP-binding cassette domain-containing protein [Pseudomonadota bacterium]